MDVYEEAAGILVGAERAVGFTGAGISAESGIPTFRDPGGIWDQFDPEDFGTSEGILSVIQRKPDAIRQFLLNTIAVFEQSRPNAGHEALAELERMGIISSVITQNIDNLHTDAGTRIVYEVHGNLFRARCVSCGRISAVTKLELFKSARRVLEDEKGFGLDKILSILPPCECGGITRPDVVMFGEAVQKLRECAGAVGNCDVMLVLGTSGVVYPAAALPQQARSSGARIIEVNPNENSFCEITDVYIDGPAGEVMARVMEHVREMARERGRS